ncbi:MAG: 16S rRNA (cytidine(1402)-2'-O)-methyltransferase [Dehalococcoidia bacterium]|nr:16S rRNA (cytidine(1402)-2'-O)-methyltransferase [Dehalococcoidia bacterium]
MGVLYVVATPIGNLEDITLRALRVLREVDLIAAEDTRTTRKLLNHYDIKAHLTSYHEHNRQAKIPILLKALETKDIALVSEAGMPGISDPGYELVLEAVNAGVSVVPIPGASALTSSLAVSGRSPGMVLFLGFLPRSKKERRRTLDPLKSQPYTIVAFESPHRLRSSLEDVVEVLGDRDMTVCRELTKMHEEVFRGKVSQAISHFVEPRGEFTLVIGGARPAENTGDFDKARADLRSLKDRGVKAKEAVALVASAYDIPKRDTYRLWIETK